VISRHQKRLTTVLVVDEAHHVSAEVLEEIRLLTNLETTQQKLLQILLVGQPELDEKLDSVELRQLKQRVALRSQLQPLDPEETRGYIQRRLLVAGANPNAPALFPAETIAAVYRHSMGIPRLINTVCENALISAYARQSPYVTPDIVEEIAADFRLGVVRPSQSEPARTSENSDARQTAKIMLDLHEYLMRMRSSDVEPPRALGPRAIKQ